MRCFGISDVGLVRSNNEDAFLASKDLGFVALADGMGGEAAGEVASTYFVDAALEVFARRVLANSKDVPNLLRNTFELANRKILDHANRYPAHSGLGCTAELLCFLNGGFAIAHVGDTRTYRLRNMELELLTKDHSYAQGLIDRGGMDKDKALRHPMRHLTMRAVGQSERLEVDTTSGDILPGDLFLLCSDGLTDYVEDHVIRKILAMPLDMEWKAGNLINAAKDSGSRDNITVVLCEFE